MPLVISPGAVNPPPVVSATSPDGILTVTADAEHAGVLLEADFSVGSVQNVDEFTGDITGWASYANGGTATVAYDAGAGGRLKATATGAATSAGAAWTLPTSIPAGRVRVVFDWTSPTGLGADRVRVVLDDAAGNPVYTRDSPARGGMGGNRWTVEADTSAPTTRVRIYANGAVGNGQILYLDNVTAASAPPERVRFTRSPGVLVRSGDPAIAAGGLAVAYDHEAPLGVAVSWTATPIWRDGTEGAVAQGVALVIPAPEGRVWLKSIDDPNLSLSLQPILPLPTFSRRAQSSTQDINDSPYPAVTYGRRKAPSSTLTLFTETLDEAQALDDLLAEGGPLLWQVTPGQVLRPNAYVVVGDVDEAPAATMDDPSRVWTLPLIEVDRIPTIDAPLYIPGHSYDDSSSAVATYDLWSVLYPTYQDSWRGALPEPEAIPPETGGGGNEGVI